MERIEKIEPDRKPFSYIAEICKKLNKKYKYEEAEELYPKLFSYYIAKQLKENGLDINDVFKNISIKYKDLDGNNTIWLGFYGTWNNQTLSTQIEKVRGKNFNMFHYTVEPLETIIIANIFQFHKIRKCLTFLSHAEEKWRNF